MRRVINDIFLFYKLPSLNNPFQNTSLKLFLQTLFLLFIGILITNSVSTIVANLIPLLTRYKNPVDGLNSKIDKLINRYGYFQYVLVLLIMPIVEEIIFRLCLIYNKTNSLIAFSIICIYSLISFYKLNYSVNTALLIFVFCGLGSLLVSFLHRNQNRLNKWSFILPAILFGILHIANYGTLQIKILYFYIFLILPQTFAGLLLGYVRVRIGIFYSVCMHILINIPAILIQLFKH